MRQRNVSRPSQSSSHVVSQAQRMLKKVDVYPKVHQDFKVQTQTGATVSVVAGVIMIILFLSEFSAYMSKNTHEHVVVDTTITDKLRINFDISFPSLTCKEAHMNSMDVAGDLQINMHNDVFKERIDVNGRLIGEKSAYNVGTEIPKDYCGSCHGARHPDEIQCCNTCDEVKQAFMNSGIGLDRAERTEQCERESSKAEIDSKEGEGCRLHGFMMVNRVAGNFHVALGRTYHRDGRLVHQFMPGEQNKYNSSHIVHSLSFGDPLNDKRYAITNPLDGKSKIAENPGTVYQYFIKVVPTLFNDGSKITSTYQFSFTEQSRFLEPDHRMSMLPGTFFVFDISAFMVQVESDDTPFTHFLTKICAIIGGMISIAGFIDSIIHHYGHKIFRSGGGAGGITKGK